MPAKKKKTTKRQTRTTQPTTPKTTVILQLADDVAPVIDSIGALANTDPATVVNVLLAMLIITRADLQQHAEPEPEPEPQKEVAATDGDGMAGA